MSAKPTPTAPPPHRSTEGHAEPAKSEPSAKVASFQPSAGRIVHYVVKEGDPVDLVGLDLRGRSSGVVYGNTPCIGDVLPATVTRAGVAGDQLVNLRVKLDCGYDDVWVGSVHYDASGAGGTYREPPRV